MSFEEKRDFVLLHKQSFIDCADLISRGARFESAKRASFKSPEILKELELLVPRLFKDMEEYTFKAQAEAEIAIRRNNPLLWAAKHDDFWKEEAPISKADLSGKSVKELLSEVKELMGD